MVNVILVGFPVNLVVLVFGFFNNRNGVETIFQWLEDIIFWNINGINSVSFNKVLKGRPAISMKNFKTYTDYISFIPILQNIQCLLKVWGNQLFAPFS